MLYLSPKERKRNKTFPEISFRHYPRSKRGTEVGKSNHKEAPKKTRRRQSDRKEATGNGPTSIIVSILRCNYCHYFHFLKNLNSQYLSAQHLSALHLSAQHLSAQYLSALHLSATLSSRNKVSLISPTSCSAPNSRSNGTWRCAALLAPHSCT